MAKQSEVLALLDPGYFEVTPKILVGHPEPTSLGHGEGVRLDLRRAVHIGDPSPGPNRPSLLALKNVHELVDDVQIDVHAGAVREMRAADHDHVVPGLDHSETPCANLRWGPGRSNVHPSRSIEHLGPRPFGDLQGRVVVSRVFSKRGGFLEAHEDAQKWIPPWRSIPDGAKLTRNRIPFASLPRCDLGQCNLTPRRPCHGEAVHRRI